MSRDSQQVVLQPATPTPTPVPTSAKVAAGAGLLESLNLGALFGFFLKPEWTALLENQFRFYLFPIAALFNFVQMGFAWNAVKNSDKEGFWPAVVRASVKTAASVAVGVAVVGALFYASVLGAAAPIIFTATLGFEALYNLAAAGFHLGAAIFGKSENKTAHMEAAKGHGIGALSLLLATTAVAGVMLLGQAAVTWFGMAAGLIGALFAVKSLVSSCLKANSVKAGSGEKQPLLNSSAQEDSSEEEVQVRDEPAPQSQLDIGRAMGIHPAQMFVPVVTGSNTADSKQEASEQAQPAVIPQAAPVVASNDDALNNGAASSSVMFHV